LLAPDALLQNASLVASCNNPYLHVLYLF
jgi:hypothetical protein